MKPYHSLYTCPAMGDLWHHARVEIQAFLPCSPETPEAHCHPSPESIFLAKNFKDFKEVTLIKGVTATQRVSITRPYRQPQPTQFTYALALDILRFILLQLVITPPNSAPQQQSPSINSNLPSVSHNIQRRHKQYALGSQCSLQPRL
jgi:hypothetical protein